MIVNNKSFVKIFTAHIIAFIIYMTFLTNFSELLVGHDEFGIGQISFAILFIIGHIIIGFTHVLYITLKRRQTQ